MDMGVPVSEWGVGRAVVTCVCHQTTSRGCQECVSVSVCVSERTPLGVQAKVSLVSSNGTLRLVRMNTTKRLTRTSEKRKSGM